MFRDFSEIRPYIFTDILYRGPVSVKTVMAYDVSTVRLMYP